MPQSLNFFLRSTRNLYRVDRMENKKTKIRIIIDAEVDYRMVDDDYHYFNADIWRLQHRHTNFIIKRINWKNEVIKKSGNINEELMFTKKGLVFEKYG